MSDSPLLRTADPHGEVHQRLRMAIADFDSHDCQIPVGLAQEAVITIEQLHGRLLHISRYIQLCKDGELSYQGALTAIKEEAESWP